MVNLNLLGNVKYPLVINFNFKICLYKVNYLDKQEKTKKMNLENHSGNFHNEYVEDYNMYFCYLSADHYHIPPKQLDFLSFVLTPNLPSSAMFP